MNSEDLLFAVLTFNDGEGSIPVGKKGSILFYAFASISSDHLIKGMGFIRQIIQHCGKQFVGAFHHVLP